nr:MAG TPA: hypothetical protein [Caudoviricetes sp.]
MRYIRLLRYLAHFVELFNSLTYGKNTYVSNILVTI